MNIIVKTTEGQRLAIVPTTVAAFVEQKNAPDCCAVWLKNDNQPFIVACTFDEFLEMYDAALNSATPGHISSAREIPQPVSVPPSAETPEQRAHRLGRLEKFQQDLRLMFPEAYVFVMEPDGQWCYNVNTSVVAAGERTWDAYGVNGRLGWKEVSSSVCDQWREELKWLDWGASMFYGQRYSLAPDTFEPFVGCEP